MRRQGLCASCQRHGMSVPNRVAMQISGHKTRSAFKYNNMVSDEDLREAASKLD
jgi:hypothetical protein